MQNMNNALRLRTFISQLEAGRSEQVAAMVVEAALPYGHLDDDWPGRGGRQVGKLSRALAKAANPKRGLSEAQLLELLQDTFAQYTAIAGAATVQPEASMAFRSWRAYLALACDPTFNIKELLAKPDSTDDLFPAGNLDLQGNVWVAAGRVNIGTGVRTGRRAPGSGVPAPLGER